MFYTAFIIGKKELWDIFIMDLSETRKRVRPTQIILIGFIAFIFFGAVLLNLPFSASSGQSIGFLTALFTSTSAVCVTGLSVIEVGTVLSPFGQVVLLLLIQIGGLGFMITTSFIFMLIGKRITLKERMVLQESLNETSLSGIVRMARNILLATLIIESIGILLLMIRFVPDFGIAKGLWFSVFHAISAFCNAGFDILGLGTSFETYVNDPIVNFTIMGLIIIGGIGFFVILEVFRRMTHHEKHKFSTHTKIILMTTIVLIVAGFAIFLIVEYNNPKTLGSLPVGNKIMSALFESVTTRTAGFSTIGQGGLASVSKLTAIILMFIGASPAGTGGGIKTSTFTVVILVVLSIIRGQDDVTVMKRRLGRDVAMRAVAITFLALAFVGVFTIALSVAESHSFEISDLLFELTSAFGTVGLSTGITAHLSEASRIILILAMYVGRVGLLTITFAIANRMSSKTHNKMKYPEDKVMVG